MTEAIYLEVTEKTEAAKKAGRQVSVSGMLKFLGVFRSGYLAWLHHVPSDTEKPVKSFRKEPLVHICAKWESVLSGANHGPLPQKILISAQNYKISLMNSLILTARMLSGVRISPTSGQ